MQNRFLLAKLQVKALSPKVEPTSLSFTDLRKELDELRLAELDLDTMYAKLAARILEQKEKNPDGQRAYRILAWVILSPRQLSIRELREAMAYDSATKTLGDPGHKDTQERIRDICDGLVTFHEDKIRLVHYTTQVYFNQNAKRLFGAFRPQIAQICTAYLSTPDLERPINEDHAHSRGGNPPDIRFPHLNSNIAEKEIEMFGERTGHDVKHMKRQFYYAAELLEQFPLLPYALQYLGYHMIEYSGASIIAANNAIVSLLKENPKVAFLYRWLGLLNLIQPEDQRRTYSFWGLKSVDIYPDLLRNPFPPASSTHLPNLASRRSRKRP